jgi:hypothetical protein
VARFSGAADQYDAVRPRPPADLVTVIAQWAGVARPDVVDLGAGTGLSSVIWAGRAHAERIRRSGLFRHCAEIAVRGREQGGAERLVGLALSAIGRAADLLADRSTEDDLGITALREVAGRRLQQPRTWWWTYRVSLAVR